jgi:hypothetical protein
MDYKIRVILSPRGIMVRLLTFFPKAFVGMVLWGAIFVEKFGLPSFSYWESLGIIALLESIIPLFDLTGHWEIHKEEFFNGHS